MRGEVIETGAVGTPDRSEHEGPLQGFGSPSGEIGVDGEACVWCPDPIAPE